MRTGRGWCPFAEQIEGVTTFSNAPLRPVGTCDHAAGGFLSTMAAASFWNGAGVSTHFAIGRNGEIIQMVNIFQQAWAQGRLGPAVSWPHWQAEGSPNPNTLFVSSEHEDWESVNGQSRAVPGSQWTKEEYAADLKLKRWMRDECAAEGIELFKYGIESLAGHYMFDAVNRSECPGRYWRDEYRARLFADLSKSSSSPEEVMQRHNATAPAWSGTLVTPGTPVRIQVADFVPAVPAGARLLRIEVYASDGGAVEPEMQVFDGDGQYAGQVGWGRGQADAYGVTDVLPQGGSFELRGVGKLMQLGITGYW